MINNKTTVTEAVGIRDSGSQAVDVSESSQMSCYKPWLHYADTCPWKRMETRLGLRCSGNIDDCGVYAPCCEDECVPYHFVKGV